MTNITNFNGPTIARCVIQGVNSSGGPLHIEIGKDDERNYILEWLCSLNAWGHHEDVCQRQTLDEQTCAWLFSSDGSASATLRQWRDTFTPTCSRENVPRILWAYGHPGIGKTVAACRIIEHLKKLRDQDKTKHDTGICWCYISMMKALDRHQLPGLILRSMLRTLAERRPDLPQLIRDLYEKHTKCQRTLPSDDEVMKCLSNLCEAQYGQVYVIADGLDEAGDHDRDVLIGYLKGLPSNTKVMFLSRYLDGLKKSIAAPLSMAIHAHGEDARLFVGQQLQKHPHFKANVDAASIKDPNIRIGIEDAMVERAKYSFLNAQLCMNILVSSKTPHGLREALRGLPSSSKEVYQAMFRRIKEWSDEDDCRWAKKILTWTCFAFQPLAPTQLQYITGIDLDQPSLKHDNQLTIPQITSLCAGLVVVHTVTRKVALVHAEAQGHLQRHEMSYLPEAHLDIATMCIAHLHAAAKVIDIDEEHEDRYLNMAFSQEDWDFTRYAVNFLAQHIRLHMHNLLQDRPNFERRLSCESLTYNGRPNYVVLRRSVFDSRTKQLCQRTVELLQSEKGLRLVSAVLVDLGIYTEQAASCTTRLHVAVALGLFDTVKYFAADRDLLDQEDGRGATALSVAINREHMDIATFLIQQGCSIDLDHVNGRRVFELAVRQGYSDMAAKMLETAIEKGEKKWMSGKPKSKTIRLLSAAFRCDVQSLKKLCGRSINASTDTAAATALLVSADQGHFGIVQVLLGAGVNVESKDLEQRTALHRAAMRNDTKMASLLISHGADVNATDRAGDTPWTAVIGRPGHRKIIDLLVKEKADVNATDRLGVSVLYTAAAGGHTPVVKRMLEVGTNPSIRTIYYWSPLHWSANNGFYDSTEILLQHGANPSAVSDTGQTPLDRSLGSGHHMNYMLSNIVGRNHLRMLSDIEKSVVLPRSTESVCTSCRRTIDQDNISFSCEICRHWICDLCFLGDGWCSDTNHHMDFRWFNCENEQSGVVQVNNSQRNTIKSRSIAALLRRYDAKMSDEVMRIYDAHYGRELSRRDFESLAALGEVAEGGINFEENADRTDMWSYYIHDSEEG